MLGLPKGEVFLLPWTVEWEQEFLLEKEKIIELLKDYVIAVHHIGSTSVKYLSAKPIIDIAVELKEFDDGAKCITSLERLGFSYKGINILPERHYFSKGEPRTHQIHMFETGCKYLVDQLAFRDQLRNSENDRIQYEQLKLKLSKINHDNKHKYAEEKTAFIISILDKIENNTVKEKTS